MKRLLIILFLILSSHAVQAWEINLAYIAKIESSNNPHAYNKKSHALGLYQITPICVRSWNKFHKHHYRHYQMYNPKIAYKVANWYYNKRIPAMLHHYHFQDTIRNRLIAYNFGIGHLVARDPLPKETINYIKKYFKLKK